MAPSVRVVDLRSDTVTKPTPEMRKAMAEAEVGDDVHGEDPTVKKLQEYAAELFGMEAALFVPSGTMGNLISVMSHCWSRGQDVILSDTSHIALYEQGGVAQLAGVYPKTIRTNRDGTLSIDEIISKITQSSDGHYTRTSLLCLENTHNFCGGVVLPLRYIEQVSQVCRRYEMPLHMDGARIMNASVKLGVPAREILKHVDSVSACFSKGLSAPVGSVIAGKREFIERAVRCRKLLGGGMRQLGVLAAAAYISLTKMVDRLEEDHRHAEMLATAIGKCGSDSVNINLEYVQTNIVMVDINPSVWTADEFCNRIGKVTDEEEDNFEEPILVKASVNSPSRVRFVLHSDIKPEDVQAAIKKIQYVIREADHKQLK